MKETICVWLDDDNRIVAHADNSENGDPCLILTTDDADIMQWIRALINLAEGYETQVDLPGSFSVIKDDAP